MGSERGRNQPSVDVEVDDAGRIIVNAPEIATQLREAKSSSPAMARTVINNGCNLVPMCGFTPQE
ncbi:hypothetical protein [Streptomyces gardneri]|uniref:Uncharacterized protein n=1 Tax=Streptomyces gardneri TaxID=66892 RepID=A0A4Y3RDD3_9ACTN|nr:hypothetical protein [Streptomyces gardneri]GEB54683.1 hypothetical protein SGA01_02880 [Streptomyces gardneri]GHG89222.1 hypothetical protein GCM10017674_15940 [Streptomyces gardneri]